MGGSSSTVILPPVGRGVPGVVQGRGSDGDRAGSVITGIAFPSVLAGGEQHL